MTNQLEMLESVRKKTKKKILYLPHAVRQMSHIDRMISPTEVLKVIEKGEIIEDYPEDVRGHSCLMLGHGANDRPVHVVCSPKEDYLAIITAYLPDSQQWENNFKKRKKS